MAELLINIIIFNMCYNIELDDIHTINLYQKIVNNDEKTTFLALNQDHQNLTIAVISSSLDTEW